jgi:acyl carrier protein
MSDVRKKLKNCFRTVFPGLPEDSIPNASTASVAGWDSVAGITLLNVIEEEFQIEVDFEKLAELNSFESLAEYLTRMTASDAASRS